MSEFSPEQVKVVVDTFIGIFSTVVKFTPTNVDDQFLDFVKEINSQPWFYDMINYVLKKVNKT